MACMNSMSRKPAFKAKNDNEKRTFKRDKPICSNSAGAVIKGAL